MYSSEFQFRTAGCVATSCRNMASAQRYRDKVVIVTGGSKGIGRGIVKVFVQNGSKVVFCARGVEEGKHVEDEFNKTGPGLCLFVSCDVSKEEDLKRLITTTVERFGQIDCLVNNAGWLCSSVPEENARQHHQCLQPGGVYRTEGRRSIRRHQGGIISMTKAMAVDESRYNVRVNCFSPGNVMTPLWEELAGHTADAAATIKEGENAQLLGRMGTEEESGLIALFLAADATFCTGVDLLLSGGAELNYGFKSQIHKI